jgi:hypothetical protein
MTTMTADENRGRIQELEERRIPFLKQVMAEKRQPGVMVAAYAEDHGVSVVKAAEMMIEDAEDEIAKLRKENLTDTSLEGRVERLEARFRELDRKPANAA